MPATPVNTLLLEGSCFSCVGMSLVEILILTELDRISQGECIIPDAPVATAATNVSVFSFTANWNASAGATSYEIDVDVDPLFSGPFTENVGNVTSRDLGGLTADTTYYYRVRAVNACGTSGNSNVITTDTLVNDNTLILDDGINPVTVIVNPIGAYDYSGENWVSVVGNNCPNLTSLNMEDNALLTSWTMINCPALVNVNVNLTALTALDLTGIATTAVTIEATNLSSLATIDGSTILTAGNITISDNTGLTVCDFGALTDVTGSMSVTSNSSLPTLDVSALESVGGNLVISSNDALEPLTLSALLTVTGILSIGLNAALEIINVGALTSAGSFLITNNLILVTLNTTALATVTGNLTINGNDLIGAIQLGGAFGTLNTVGGSIIIQNNAALANINLDDLTSVGGSIGITSNPSIVVLEMASLVTVGADLLISDPMNSLSLTALEAVGGLLTLSDTSVADFGMTLLETVGGTVTIQTNGSLTVLNLNAFTAPFAATPTSITDNAVLAAFSMNGQPLNDGQDYIFENNSLNQASVDLVLAAGVAGAMTSGTIALQGGTNSAPGAQGTIDKAALQTAGVTVTTN